MNDETIKTKVQDAPPSNLRVQVQTASYPRICILQDLCNAQGINWAIGEHSLDEFNRTIHTIWMERAPKEQR